MIGVLYFLGILKPASLFNEKARKGVAGRKKWREKLPQVDGREVFWFHCASLGEFDQGLPVMNYIKNVKKDAFILVTFFSPSGIEHYHKRQHSVDHAMYLPTDNPSNARFFIDYFQPKMTVFVKYEFWYNFIKIASKKGNPVVSICASFRRNQPYFNALLKGKDINVLHRFDYFLVQNKLSQELLFQIGITKVQVTGDTRYDRVLENKRQLQNNPIIDEFVANSRFTFIGGSVWPQDLRLLKNELLIANYDRIILAPHNVDEVMIKKIEELFPGECIRFTDYKPSNKRILILDTIGHLASAYSYGDVAYVGGGFSGKLHNILEPAVFGLPVIFGPKHNRFPEAHYFIDSGIGFSVKNQLELSRVFQELSPEKVNELKPRIEKMVEANEGAADKIGEILISSLKS